MKRTLFILSAICSILYSCRSQSDGGDPIGTVPSVESVSIEDGSENTAVGLGYIDINYDIPILIKDTSLISLSGTTVKPSVANMRLRVGFGTLEYGTSYTLSVPAGAVTGKYGSVPAADFHVSFTTVPKPGGDIPYTPEEPGDYSQSPVTSDPINNAKLLYDYLLSIYGGKILSGAMAKVAWNTDEAGWIYKWTGKYPAIATFDYIHLPDSPTNWIDYSDITPVLDWWNAKGLVGAGWHWIVPTYEGSTSYTYDPSKTDFKPSNVVVDGTWENKVAKADLAKISSYLLLLQDHNIPVIWRPLHEAAGNTYTQWKSGAWFWWGKDGAEAYKALWRFMFDYFRDAGVRNLIWVWVTQTSEPGDSDYEFYPGDDYVDIVGRDIYGDKSNDYIVSSADIESQFETITHMIPHKMAALSEMGSVDNISKQRDAGAEWLYFMPWYDYDNDYTEDYDHLYAGISWWRQSFLDSSVLTRSDLPSDIFPDWNK